MKKFICLLIFAVILASQIYMPAQATENTAGFGWIVHPKYDFIWPFSEGIAKVELGDKCGYVDKTGKLITPIQYDDYWNFSQNSVIGINTGDKDWKLLSVAMEEDKEYAWGFSEGMAVIERDISGFHLYGFIDKSGKEVIKLKYSYAASFHDGLAFVRSNERCGFVDKTGKEAIPLLYEQSNGYNEGLAAVRKDRKWGFVDKSGRVAIPFEYDYAGPFSDGLAYVTSGGESFFIDKTGKKVINLKYDYAEPFAEGMAKVNLHNTWGFIDKTGREITAVKYTYAKNFCEGMAAVCIDGKWGFIDKTGREIIALQYDDVDDFTNGTAGVTNSGNPETIDKTGRVVINLKYDRLSSFKDNIAAYSRNNKLGFVDIKGREVIKPQFDDTYGFIDGIAPVKINNKWGLIKLTNTSPTGSAAKIAKPVAPKGFSAVVKGTTASLSWTKTTGADYYNVYYKSEGGSYKKVKVSGTNKQLTGLKQVSRYYFKVTAVNASGESPASSEVVKNTGK